MDYKAFLDNFTRVACVLSVDLKAADSKDRYFVVDANDAYKLTVVKKLEDFECNVPYTRYIQQADNFEALCDECVTKDRPVHTYFDIELYNAWMEVFFTPLASSDPDKKYILFSNFKIGDFRSGQAYGHIFRDGNQRHQDLPYAARDR